MQLDALSAYQFALMLQAGMPPEDIIAYFLPDAEPGHKATVLSNWLRSRQLQEAVKDIQGKEWQLMSNEERIQRALDKHYAELAYFLYTHNYSAVAGLDKTKADTARSVLETKLAGLAGKTNAIDRWWEEMKAKSDAESKPSKGPVLTLPAS
jgi:hypothetical protein